jgi:opacity protein-like surface antigen
MKKAIIIIAIAVLTGGMVSAQTYTYESSGMSTSSSPTSYYTFAWNFAFPMGDFKNWVDKASIAGFDVSGHYFVKNGLTVGFDIAWQRVGQTFDNQTFVIPDSGVAITATNYRESWMIPFGAVVGYHFIPDKMVSPYVSLGIGGDYMEHHLMIQEFDIWKSVWDFSLTPEVGVLAKFGKYSGWGGMAAVNYKWTTNKIEMPNETFKSISMVNLKVGIVYFVK